MHDWKRTSGGSPNLSNPAKKEKRNATALESNGGCLRDRRASGCQTPPRGGRDGNRLRPAPNQTAPGVSLLAAPPPTMRSRRVGGPVGSFSRTYGQDGTHWPANSKSLSKGDFSYSCSCSREKSLAFAWYSPCRLVTTTTRRGTSSTSDGARTIYDTGSQASAMWILRNGTAVAEDVNRQFQGGPSESRTSGVDVYKGGGSSPSPSRTSACGNRFGSSSGVPRRVFDHLASIKILCWSCYTASGAPSGSSPAQARRTGSLAGAVGERPRREMGGGLPVWAEHH